MQGKRESQLLERLKSVGAQLVSIFSHGGAHKLRAQDTEGSVPSVPSVGSPNPDPHPTLAAIPAHSPSMSSPASKRRGASRGVRGKRSRKKHNAQYAAEHADLKQTAPLRPKARARVMRGAIAVTSTLCGRQDLPHEKPAWGALRRPGQESAPGPQQGTAVNGSGLHQHCNAEVRRLVEVEKYVYIPSDTGYVVTLRIASAVGSWPLTPFCQWGGVHCRPRTQGDSDSCSSARRRLRY